MTNTLEAELKTAMGYTETDAPTCAGCVYAEENEDQAGPPHHICTLNLACRFHVPGTARCRYHKPSGKSDSASHSG